MVICVATASRPAQLDTLVGSLEQVEVPPGVDMRLVVVDNGPDQEVFRRKYSLTGRVLDTTVVTELRRGIPYARNTSVEVALRQGADFLAFVDDDEQVTPLWLLGLLTTVGASDASVVSGPVLPTFPPGTPRWAEASGLYERRRLPTGHPLRWVATNNTLVSSEVFALVQPWFDPRFASTGGSDVEYFQRVSARGIRMVWCDEAIVYEHLPRERTRIRWATRRALRIGTVAGSELARNSGKWSRPVLLRAARSVGVLAASPFLLLTDLPKGWKAARRARLFVRQIGILMGLAGVVISEYEIGSERP